MCILKMRITAESTDNANRRNKNLTFNNNTSFKLCISKINNSFTGNAEDLDIVMSTYKLLEYSDNYCMTS